ncbi:hypothetical protein [Magnetovibrio sp.]|uniref:hypothetical protein n=1 Tax=Magnetovibrio sp. TaxID=2024836 RepID=UPI002F937BD7
MFLRVLNDDQKRVLVVIAHHLVVSDHSISEKEGDLLDELLNGLHTNVPVSPQQLYAKPSLDVFDTREVKIAAMLEILTLACGDNMFPDAESKMVRKLARDFGFTNDEFEQMKAWGENNAVLRDQALAMMDAT